MEKKYYTLKELTMQFIKEFELENGTQEEAIKTYQQKISRTLKQLNLWNKAKCKAGTHYFTEDDKIKLLNNPKFYYYLCKRSTKDEFCNYEIIEEIERRRIAYIESTTDRENNPYTDDEPYVSHKEFQECKNNIMLEALFNLFFTTFDDRRLENDIYCNWFTKEEANLTFKDIAIEKRLLNPEGSYFHRRNLKDVLNRLQSNSDKNIK